MIQTPEQIFQHCSQLAEATPNKWTALDASIKLTITGAQGGSWLVDSSEQPIIKAGAASDNADCELAISAESLAQIIDGSLNPQQAYLSGKLQIAGSLQAALQCNKLFELICEPR